MEQVHYTGYRWVPFPVRAAWWDVMQMEENQIEIEELLGLALNEKHVRDQGECWMSLLGCAISKDMPMIVEQLLNVGIDPNDRCVGYSDGSWGRPLHSAMGNRRIVELLLRHGADPSLRSSDGHTAFHLAEQLDRGTLNWLNCFVKLRSGRLAAVWCMNNMRGVWPDLVEVVIDRLVATEVEHWEE